jgi:hypothetical protein
MIEMPRFDSAILFLVVISQAMHCAGFSWPHVDSAVISANGVYQGRWGQVLCLTAGQALVCWDIWAPGSQSAKGWVEGRVSAGNCSFDRDTACAAQSGLSGASLESIQDLTNPDDLNVTSDGTVFR